VRKDVMHKANKRDLSFLDSVIAGVYTVPGDGMVDFVGVLKHLKGYSGWIVVEAEQDPARAPPAEYVTMGYDNLGRFLKEAGLRR
jgi:inosose dehydratase